MTRAPISLELSSPGRRRLTFACLAGLTSILLAIGCATPGKQPETTLGKTACGEEESAEGASSTIDEADEHPTEEFLDAESVRRVVEAGENRVQSCYQSWLDHLAELEELDHDSPPGGRVILVFEIGADGEVGNASLVQDAVGGEAFEHCILEEISRWSFPPPAPGDAPTVVEVPFFFEPRLE